MRNILFFSFILLFLSNCTIAGVALDSAAENQGLTVNPPYKSLKNGDLISVHFRDGSKKDLFFISSETNEHSIHCMNLDYSKKISFKYEDIERVIKKTNDSNFFTLLGVTLDIAFII